MTHIPNPSPAGVASHAFIDHDIALGALGVWKAKPRGRPKV